MAPPAQYNHCKTVYSAMYDNSHEEKVDGVMVRVWVGHSTKLFMELGLPTPYYTSVMQKLQAMQCVLQLHRGGGGGESKWACLIAPSRELYEHSKDRVTGRPSEKDTQIQRLKDMHNRILQLDSGMEDMLNEVDLRLKMIETQLTALAEEVQKINARFNP
jgi:hypothetical protein